MPWKWSGGMPATEQPVWLLDFDGVLNILAPRGDTSVWEHWEVRGESSNPETIPWYIWAPEAVKLVAEARDAGVRVVWLTSWMGMTQRLHQTIPELPAGLEFLHDGFGGPSKHWKVNAARANVPDSAPLLWTDDELKVRLLREKATKEWIRERAGDTTIIAPLKRHGITPRDAAVIREWIVRVTR